MATLNLSHILTDDGGFILLSSGSYILLSDLLLSKSTPTLDVEPESREFDAMQTTIPIIEKDPNARLNYTLKWGRWLQRSGYSEITSVEWFVTGGDGELEILDGEWSPILTDGILATVYLAGGTPKVKYRVTCRITAGNPEISEDRSFYVWVVDR